MAGRMGILASRVTPYMKGGAIRGVAMIQYAVAGMMGAGGLAAFVALCWLAFHDDPGHVANHILTVATGSSAGAIEMQGRLRVLIVGGTLVYFASFVLKEAASGWKEAPPTWLHSRGRIESVREANRLRALPSIEAIAGIAELVVEIGSAAPSAASELLDRRIARALGIAAPIRPTRSADDAQQLLVLRYGGARSELQWRIEPVRGGVRLEVRRDETSPWERCSEGRGRSQVLATVAAVLARETFMPPLRA